jgi:hypothetical protein
MGDWIDAFSLSWVVPLVLDSMMSVAMAVYDYFVGGGDGIIYVLIWGFLGLSIGIYLAKMYFPKEWLALFGFSDGGEMYGAGIDAWEISRNVLKPMLRAMFAIVILLQVKPQYITNFVVNPFLEFGAVYVNSITSVILPDGAPKTRAKCPSNLGDYLTKDSCDFLINPIDEISAVNNGVIKKGFGFIDKGYRQITIPVLGIFMIKDGLLNIITGLLLVATFFSSNLFMALLIIHGIFKLGFSLILYPFKVMLYVVKKDDSAYWFNPWPALDDLVNSLKKLVVAMIAVAFMLLVNISIAGAMFNFDADSIQGFGGQSIGWLTCIMTFWLLQQVFTETNKKLNEYVNDSAMTNFYKNVTDGVKAVAKNTTDWGTRVWGIIKGKK